MIKTTNQAATRLRTAALEQQHCFALHPRCPGPTSHHHFKLKIQVKIVVPSFFLVHSVSHTQSIIHLPPKPSDAPKRLQATAEASAQRHASFACLSRSLHLHGRRLRRRHRQLSTVFTRYAFHPHCRPSPAPPMMLFTRCYPLLVFPTSLNLNLMPFSSFLLLSCLACVPRQARLDSLSRGSSAVQTSPWTGLATEKLDVRNVG